MALELLNLCLQGGVLCLSGHGLSHPSFPFLNLCDEELLLLSRCLSVSCPEEKKNPEEISNSRKNDGKKGCLEPNTQVSAEERIQPARGGQRAVTASQDRGQEGKTGISLLQALPSLTDIKTSEKGSTL